MPQRLSHGKIARRTIKKIRWQAVALAYQSTPIRRFLSLKDAVDNGFYCGRLLDAGTFCVVHVKSPIRQTDTGACTVLLTAVTHNVMYHDVCYHGRYRSPTV